MSAVPCSNDNFYLPPCMTGQFVCCAPELELFKDIGAIEVLQLLLYYKLLLAFIYKAVHDLAHEYVAHP